MKYEFAASPPPPLRVERSHQVIGNVGKESIESMLNKAPRNAY